MSRDAAPPIRDSRHVADGLRRSDAPSVRPRRRRLWIALIFAGLLSVVLIHGSRRHPAPALQGVHLSRDHLNANHFSDATPATLGSTLRVATFNIHRGRGPSGHTDLNLTAQSIAGFDLVGLNEVAGTLPWRRTDQAEQLGRASERDWLFVPTETRWWHPHFGNGLLSRIPINSWNSIPLASHASGGHRALIEAKFDLSGESISLIVAHVTREADQQSQLRATIDRFLDAPAPAILIGDLNIPSSDPRIKRLTTTQGVTNASANLTRACELDWIFTRGFTVKDAGVIDLGASDHPVIWAELKLAPARTAAHPGASTATIR